MEVCVYPVLEDFLTCLAAMLCSPLTRQYLINYARPLIYTTSMSFPSLAAIKTVYSLMEKGVTEPVSLAQLQYLQFTETLGQLIMHLNELISHMYSQLATLSPYTLHPQSGATLLQLPPTIPRSPIFSLLTPNPRDLAKHCQVADFTVRPIVPPTVPEGTQRIRVCLHAGNTEEDVERLVVRIGNWLKIQRNVDGSEELRQDVVKSSL
jgi:8-amino-7-oxononanoate synthase